MSRFANVPRQRFGTAPAAERDAVPSHPVRANARRMEMLWLATDLTAHVPQQDETVHALITGRCDLMMVVSALLGKFGPAEHVRITTLSFNGRNLQEVFALADAASFGRLTLICSSFFRDHNHELWEKGGGVQRARPTTTRPWQRSAIMPR
jgi:hypothetical protein